MSGSEISEEKFLRIYEEAEGDFYKFNNILHAAGERGLAIATFYRRRLKWVNGISPNRNATAKKSSADTKLPKEDPRPVAGGTINPPDRTRRILKGRRFVFTSAQNNTFVHPDFWANLLAFCKHRDAQLVIGKFRYNKSGFQNATAEGDDELWYDPELAPYFVPESLALETGTVWCGELDILPTAATPLSGLETYTRTATGIVPHAKVQMQSIPTMKGAPNKFMYTTGTVTQRNYIQRKAGQKAEFHHVFGALYVEIDDEGAEFRRQLIADSTGTFYDLTDKFSNGNVHTGCRVEAINWGDMHVEAIDPRVALYGWGPLNSMLNQLQPYHQFVHDLTDFKARNHHNIKNPHFLAEMHYNNTDSVRDGMKKSADLLAQLQRDWCTTVVVESNHDQAFRRWLAEANITSDPVNALYYHEANAEIFKGLANGYSVHIFEWAVRRENPTLDNTVFLNEDDSYIICGAENGIECGMHGHRGPNGARGSPNGFRRLGRKCNTGHSHSAGIIDGVYTAGISCQSALGYNAGPSSWSQSHIVTYPNGKRTIITMQNGKWRA